MRNTPPDPRSPKDVWDEQHRLLAETPFAWVLKADALIAAFEVLIEADERASTSGDDSPQLSSVTYMLAGFAIEVLLKALLIRTESPLSANGRFQLNSHHLAELAQAASFPLMEGESDLLERLEQFLTWAGRYPIPLTSGPMRPRTTPDGGFAPRTYHNVGEDWPGVRALIARLKQTLPVINYERNGV
jgi:hypothetical protein